MTYPERSTEAAQMAVDMANATESGWILRDVKRCGVINAFAGYIDETLAFRRRVDEVARYVCHHTTHGLSSKQLLSIMLPDPVDPDVLLARKVAASVALEDGFTVTAALIERGAHDDRWRVKYPLAGIKAAREADNG